MSSLVLGRDTVYKQYVFKNVSERVGEAWKAYNYDELAALVGLKPTHNFKKRVRQMVEAGLLKSCTAFTPRGGLAILFHSPSVEPSEIPF